MATPKIICQCTATVYLKNKGVGGEFLGPGYYEGVCNSCGTIYEVTKLDP